MIRGKKIEPRMMKQKNPTYNGQQNKTWTFAMNLKTSTFPSP